MKKYILFFLLMFLSSPVKSDAIFFPYPFTGICYSLEAIYSYEKLAKPNSSTAYWAGFGHVGSIIARYNEPVFGFEAAIERRYYFRPDNYKHLFISAYLGTAFMTEFSDFSSIGLIPGVKLNYKANLSQNFVIEPYISLSLPITHMLTKYPDTIAFPALTFGARLGINKIRK